MKRLDIVERLMKFHLSRQEAQLYICLKENGNLTGYEASKISGISRSNVYAALNSLVEKGAALASEGTTLIFTAVEPTEFLDNKMKELRKDRDYIIKQFPEKEKDTKGYFTIQGNTNIKNKIFHMIENCEMRLYFSAESEILREYESLLMERKKEGKKVVLMSNDDYSEISTMFYFDEPGKGQIRLITDSSYVLTGELTGKNTDTCLYSEQENLVRVMKDALGNKIKLLELEKTERKEEDD